MPVILSTGSPTVPGDVIYTAPASAASAAAGPGAKRQRLEGGREAEAAAEAAEAEVRAGAGCYTRLVAAAGGAAERQYVSSRVGVVQWDGSAVAVLRRGEGPVGARLVLGPRPGDQVHLRVLRVSRAFVFGDIVAVGGQWCSRRGAQGGAGFRGVLRVEDIRPFRPSREQLEPPAPALSFQSGDVVMAEVISQSDVRQFQLSTHGEHCGVVEGHAVAPDGRLVRLHHVPGRRDVMRDPTDNRTVPRWCPLLAL